ncbi:MAG: cobyrinate a,c-diamide synthase [Nitrospirota bacterium]
MQNVPRLVISAVRGGLGKTTLSLGITAAWRNQGKQIASFKKGPDFIDAGWLGAAAGRPCYNLDLFLMDEENILRSFALHAAGMDAAVIEGNRGLYDGMDDSGTYSTARLAKLIGSPVVLIVDCTKSSATVAAVVLGSKLYDPSVALRGIILNNVSPGRHESVIRKAIEQSSGIPVVGAVPRLMHGEFPERHMGLTPFHEHPDVEKAIAVSATVAEKYLDLAALWRIAGDAGPVQAVQEPDVSTAEADRPTVGVIRDKAFQFYYPDNLEALEQQGAILREINALQDRELPSIDALYIGGGFPETQAAKLAGNVSFAASLRAAVEKGLPVYAECGGLIYLGRSLRVGDAIYPMTSVLPADFILEKKPQAHGYTQLDVHGPNPFFEISVALRGHEFHYSRIVNLEELHGMVFSMRRGHGIDGLHDGIVYKNVLATYTHIHALGSPLWAQGMVKKAREYRMTGKQGVR